MSERTEFGYRRSVCGCYECQTNCQFMPGMLIPADLDRLIPPGQDPFAWASENLLASPGSVVSYQGDIYRIPNLVPATRADGSCINLVAGRCTVHANAPYGCAFFSCKDEIFDPREQEKSRKAITAISRDFANCGLYAQLWAYLAYHGKTQVSAGILRDKIRKHLSSPLNYRRSELVSISV